MKKLILTLATLSCLASCTNKDKQNAAAQRVKQATIDSIEYANKQQHKIDSLEALTKGTATALEVESPAMIPIPEGHKKVAPRKHIHSVNPAPGVNAPQASGNTNSAPASGNATVAPAANSTVAATPEKKKGLNNAAKGALIGLGTGAAAGAIIGKDNRGKGAVVGGVLGAIGGAVGGAVIDRHKEKKAAAAKDTIK